MANLDSLRIEGAPPAFAEYAAKHNRLVAVIEMLTGANGIKITVSENNAVIEIDPEAEINAQSITLNGSATMSSLSVSGDAGIEGSLTVIDGASIGGDTFVDYLESSGDVYAHGAVYLQETQLTFANMDICDSGSPADKNFVTQL